jgi:osmoprotectant transport system permease protein
VPLGVAVQRRPGWRAPVFSVLNLLQTIPSLALFGLLLAPLAAVAALIGAGGLGAIVFEGLYADALDLVMLGVVPMTLLALAVDGALRGLEQASRRA